MEIVEIMIWFLVCLVSFLFLSELVLLVTPWKNTQKVNINSGPLISILVCVRNEEQSLADCIESLLAQNYPRFEVWLIDDHSTDSSRKILSEYETKGINWIKAEGEPNHKQNPKAFLLNQLQNQAKGEFLAIADADCVYNSRWISGLYQESEGKAILSGISGVRGSGLQNAEWLGALGRISLLEWKDCPVAVGNNMMVRKESLVKIGGFVAAMDSLTEDVKMNRLAIDAGLHTHLVNSKGVVSKTLPVSFFGLFPQRSRWMEGLKLIPWYLKCALYIQSLHIIWVILLGCYDLHYGLIALIGYSMIKILVDIKILIRIKEPIRPMQLIFLEIFRFISAPLFIIFRIFTKKIIWKDREYKGL